MWYPRESLTHRLMRSFAIVLTLSALTFGARPFQAQQPSASRGTSFTFGLSRGAGALTCSYCTEASESGLSGIVGVETRFRPAVRLGLEGEWWMHSSNGTSQSVLAALPVMHFYATPSSALFFKLGLGIGRYTASSDEEELRTTALSAMVGAGYEFRLANRNALVPYVSWLRGGRGTMRLNGARVTPYSGLSLLQYGLAFSKR